MNSVISTIYTRSEGKIMEQIDNMMDDIHDQYTDIYHESYHNVENNQVQLGLDNRRTLVYDAYPPNIPITTFDEVHVTKIVGDVVRVRRVQYWGYMSLFFLNWQKLNFQQLNIKLYIS